MPNEGKLGRRPSGLVPIRIRPERAAWRESERGFGTEDDFGLETGAWNIEKVEAFRDGFYEFLGYLRINSKERGGNYCLADGVYEAQYRLLDAIWDGLSEDIHDFKVLKSRQLGISTISRALVTFWIGMHPGMQGATIFDTEAHKEEAREEIEQMIASLPKSLGFPRILKMNRYNMMLSNNSRLRFMAAGVNASRSSGVLGRSSGINLVHASEVCSWNNEEGVIALKNALSQNFADRLYLWESTARGYNQWHDLWEEAKQDDLHQRTVFIGWWAKDDQRLRTSSAAFQRYGTEPLTDKERERIEDVFKQYDYEVDAEQLAWYRSWTDPLRERDEDEPEDLFMLADQPWCVVAETRVGTTQGIVRIADAEVGSHGTRGEITAAMPMGSARIWRARTKLGYEIRGTADHPLIAPDRSRVLLSQALGAMVALQPPLFAEDQYVIRWQDGIVEGQIRVTAEFARLVGIFLGDGSISGAGPRSGWEFAIACNANDRDVIDECHRLIRACFPVETQERTVVDERFPNAKGWTQVRTTSKIIYETFKRLNLIRHDTGPSMRQMRVPEFIWRSPRRIVAEFLSGLFEADGFNGYETHQCKLFSKWEVFLAEVQILLLAFGITSRRKSVEKINGEGRTYTGNELHLRSSEAQRFNEEIGFISARKRSRPREMPTTGRLGRRAPPIMLEDEVVLVEDTGIDEEVYNLTIVGEHLFDANGILTHNTEGEAFQQTGSTFFENIKLREHMELASRKRPSGYSFRPGTDFVTTQIFPARVWRDVDIQVWEEPVADAIYVVAADPAFGHRPESSNSCAQVGRCYADQIEQVAEFTSTSTLTHQLAYLLWALVGWYGNMPGNQVMTIIEINGPGEAVWREYGLVRPIVQNGYLQVPAREKGLTDIFNNSRNYLYQRSDSMHPGKNYHWKTSQQLKVAIMERTRDMVHNGGIVINSMGALEEMKAITRNGDDIGAEGRQRDDRVMALALMIRCWEEKLRRGLIAQKRTKEAEVGRRRMNVVDQYRIFNEYTLANFFETKTVGRRDVAMAEAQRQLHMRARLSSPPRGLGSWRR